jgi:hypothetical protein
MDESLDSDVAIATLRAREKLRNRPEGKPVMSIMYRFLLFAFRKERFRLLLFACALLAAGCAHDGSDASDEHPHHHGGHRGGRGGEQSFTNPSPTPSGF